MKTFPQDPAAQTALGERLSSFERLGIRLFDNDRFQQTVVERQGNMLLVAGGTIAVIAHALIMGAIEEYPGSSV